METKLTKQERLKIYKGAINYIESYIEAFGYYSLGICAAINETISDINNISPYEFINDISPYLFIEEYPELCKYKPNDVEDDEYWFPTDHEGDEKRLSILREIVAEMEKELNTNKQ